MEKEREREREFELQTWDIIKDVITAKLSFEPKKLISYFVAGKYDYMAGIFGFKYIF